MGRRRIEPREDPTRPYNKGRSFDRCRWSFARGFHPRLSSCSYMTPPRERGPPPRERLINLSLLLCSPLCVCARVADCVWVSVECVCVWEREEDNVSHCGSNRTGRSVGSWKTHLYIIIYIYIHIRICYDVSPRKLISQDTI